MVAQSPFGSPTFCKVVEQKGSSGKTTAKIMKTIQKKTVDTNKMPEDKVEEYLDCNLAFNIMCGKLSNAGKL